MKCLTQVVNCVYSALEYLGLYEPEITIQEARKRLREESDYWETYQHDRSSLWQDFQDYNPSYNTIGALKPLVKRAITLLESRAITQGVAVDLGCGLNSTVIHLLEKGWKVYAVDSSEPIIETLKQKVSSLGKNWIENGQLVLCKQTIEEFQYPEKVHLITATDSLPYCDPNRINDIFLTIKDSLLPQGVFAGNFFPYDHNPTVDLLLRNVFGAWLTSRNVIEAVSRSANFSSWSVIESKNSDESPVQIHVIARA